MPWEEAHWAEDRDVKTNLLYRMFFRLLSDRIYPNLFPSPYPLVLVVICRQMAKVNAIFLISSVGKAEGEGNRQSGATFPLDSEIEERYHTMPSPLRESPPSAYA